MIDLILLAILLMIAFSGVKRTIMFFIKILDMSLIRHSTFNWIAIVCNILVVLSLFRYRNETICNIPIIAIIIAIIVLTVIAVIFLFIKILIDKLD